MSDATILDRLKGLIENNLEVALPEDAAAGHRLYEDLNIDSIMVLQLVVYIEEEFGVAVPEEDVDPAVFQTLGSLVDFVERLRANSVA
ncbi:hypothetical protein J19TS2_32780 [Cohnella xylanilytica]|uniref:Acyl carrier protein n=1 Tax=Cohnella xylanilytica TaxID=557555 RepID=A0A841TRC0_9BACL|nr:phosphopantetheine-binding protein [Cohnella xylanilytica]MBB6690927.1 acyl carrier protein [Cohnella xylanilytica]GIO13723.1 hypothetical protein J19TS2_32780 [Cohnella xylanilytica]